jgi:uncharacterized caspase-like protein
MRIASLAAGLSFSAAAQQPARDLRVDTVVQRHALILGNESYAKWPLKNPVNDARSMDQALREAGFRTQLVLNSSLREMERAIDRFIATLRAGDIAAFYYSGHGIQLSGENYLVPVDFDAKDEADAKYASYSVSRVRERIELSGARLSLLILDACRNNPFRTSRAAGGGLAAMDTGRGTFIAFSTGPGKVADDNPVGTNGLFTGHLVAAIREPGLTLDQVFNRVREQVYAESQQQQLPWTVSSVIGEFRFSPGTALDAAASPAAPVPASPPIGERPMNPLLRSHLGLSESKPTASAADAEPLVDEAVAAASRGDYNHAIETSQQVLRTRPNDKRALTALAEGYYQTGQYDLFPNAAADAVRQGAEMRFTLIHHHTLTGGHASALKWSASTLSFDPMGARDCNQKPFELPLSTLISATRTTDPKSEIFLTLRIRDQQGKNHTLNFADGRSTVDSSSGFPVLVSPAGAMRAMEALAAALNRKNPK